MASCLLALNIMILFYIERENYNMIIYQFGRANP